MPKKRSQKSDKTNDTDVSAARGRLMGALQGIIHGSEDESNDSDDLSDDQTMDEDHNDVSSLDHTLLGRRRREGATDCTHTYIMKLYDRSVDLTAYTEDTPLYPICRAWISNQPKLRANRRLSQLDKKPQQQDASSNQNNSEENHNKSGVTSTSFVKREVFSISECMTPDGDIKDIYALPAPIDDDDENDYSEDENDSEKDDGDRRNSNNKKNNSRSRRVPPKMEMHEAKDKQQLDADLDYDSDTPPPDRDCLLRDHLRRWSDIRRHWQRHSASNETRYERSAAILQAIYNKAQENMEM